MPAEEISFRERKAAQLAAERGEQQQPEQQPVDTPDPDDGTPDLSAESAKDLIDDGMDQADDDTEGALSEDLDDETPEEEEPDEASEGVDWEQRYKDTQAKLSEVTENRREMEQEHAESVAENLRLKFDLEDKLSEVKDRAQFFVQMMSGNAQQYHNIDWSKVPPDQLQNVQQQAQQAFALEQQAKTAFEQAQQQLQEARNFQRQREAQIANIRLRRTIPNWSKETYNRLKEHAAQVGTPAEVFGQITDPGLMEMIHDSLQLRAAPGTVSGRKTKRKAQTPRSRQAQQQHRNSVGQFEKAKQHFKDNPNQPGAFADMKARQLAMERERR